MNLELYQIRLPLAAFRLDVEMLRLKAEEGILGLSGPSGSGKTTLLEIIAGLRRPAAGRVILGGRTLTDLPGRRRPVPAWRRGIGYVPQDQGLFPHWNVRQNLGAAPRFRGRPAPAGLLERITGLLELEPLLPRFPATLSGGEKARVALGRALMAEPALLLLDEPLAHLDDRLRMRALDYLKATAALFRLPMVLVSHSAWELGTACGRILSMESGSLRQPEDRRTAGTDRN